MVYGTSNGLQNDISNYLGPCSRVQVKSYLSCLGAQAQSPGLLSVAGQFSPGWFMEASGNQGNPTDLNNAQALWEFKA